MICFLNLCTTFGLFFFLAVVAGNATFVRMIKLLTDMFPASVIVMMVDIRPAYTSSIAARRFFLVRIGQDIRFPGFTNLPRQIWGNMFYFSNHQNSK